MNYKASINYLDSLQSTDIKLGLERISAACAAFGHPEKKFPSVIVAGTNGKGSTCAFFESILRHIPSPLMPVRQSSGGGGAGQGAGGQGVNLKVGLYTSPHLLDVRERIQIDRRMISKRDFTKIVEQIAPPFPKGGEGGFSDKQLTYFEFLTLMAFIHFAEQRVDIAVLEVGLGGRFDATNVATPLAGVITRIGLDHEKYLGNTLEKIAFEKAGIIKEGVSVVTVDQYPEVMRVIRDIAEEKHAMLHVVSPQEVKYKLGLLGEHQNENAALAIRVGEIVVAPFMGPKNVAEGFSLPSSCGGLKPAATELALASTRWPGRLEIVSKKPLVILDGAHNPNGAKALARYLLSIKGIVAELALPNYVGEPLCGLPRFREGTEPLPYKVTSNIIAIFGAMEDKDIKGLIAPLLPVVDEWVITRPDMERAASIEIICKILRGNVIPAKAGISRNKLDSRWSLPPNDLIGGGDDMRTRISEFPNVKTAIKETLAAMSKNDTLLITGSLYLVAEAKEYFGARHR